MTIRFSPRMLKALAAGVIVAAGLSVSPRASAQFGEAAGIGEAMQPDYFKRDVVIISQGLNLDEAQRIILNTMFDDYNGAFEDGLTRMKKRFEDMREELQAGASDAPRIMKLVFAPFRDWSDEKAQIGTQFMANIEVLLTTEQQQLWPAVQRRLYRERMLHRGRLSGENLNLIDVVRDLNLDQRVTLQIQPVMDAYEIALDRALHEREDPMRGKSNVVLQSLEEQDSSKLLAAQRKHIERQVGVRNVNDEYIEKVAMTLPGDLAQQFRLSALDRAYPRIYRETPVQRIFRVAALLEGLAPDVHQAVLQLESEFLTDLGTMNQQLLTALRTHEPVEAAERATDFAQRMDGMQVEPKSDPTRELFAQRDQMSRDYVKRLKALLTEAQFLQLPGASRWIDPPPQTETALEAPQRGKAEKVLPPGVKQRRGSAKEETPD